MLITSLMGWKGLDMSWGESQWVELLIGVIRNEKESALCENISTPYNTSTSENTSTPVIGLPQLAVDYCRQTALVSSKPPPE